VTADGRDATSGRFTPGHNGGPGLPRGTKLGPSAVNLRRLVARKAAEAGTDVETIAWSVFAAMIARARGGDVRAAQLVLDYLCDKEALELLVKHEGAVPTGPAPVPDTATLAGYLCDLAKLPDGVRTELVARAARADGRDLDAALGD
jgi:hypothetical protein